jgi:hypothetical protein
MPLEPAGPLPAVLLLDVVLSRGSATVLAGRRVLCKIVDDQRPPVVVLAWFPVALEITGLQLKLRKRCN